MESTEYKSLTNHYGTRKTHQVDTQLTVNRPRLQYAFLYTLKYYFS